MSIDREQVDYVAHLSRIALSEEAAEKFTLQLDSIIQYIDKLNELDTKDVEPMTQALLGATNVFRKDEAGPSLSQNDALGQAPSSDNGFYKVPRVI